MLQFRNQTGFAGTVFVSPDPDGVDTLYTVVKGTFDLENGLSPAAEQVPVVLAAEHYGDPAASSIRVPSDVSLIKPGTDVLLLGHAYGPGGRPTTYVDVTLMVGPVQRVVRVFGDRFWVASAAGAYASPPEPFERMPLVWERAFGGTDRVGSEVHGDPRNPVGTGYRAPDSEIPLDGFRLPNLEDPYEPITSWKQRPAPACFAPVAPQWEPRRSYAGTYDERWQRERAPYLPVDFDARFFQLAPPGLVVPGYLRGGEPVEVLGATPEGRLSFRLPALRIEVAHVVAGEWHVRPANLDTVIIEPDDGRLILVWRTGFACDKSLLRIEAVEARVVWTA